MEPKQKILIVDDSEINRAMLKEILGEGYEYLEAENGLRAIEILRRRTDIALVLLDLIMPEMDGFDVLRVMQCYAWQEEIPVIVISAAEDTRSVERAYDMGVDTDGRWGSVVCIEDSAGHLWRVCGTADPTVQTGDEVSVGQILGRAGSIPNECAEETHIHLEVLQGEQYLDPAKLLN
jgi:CheY-like chemotaxis protein